MHALILFAHGSRDPLWRAPFDTLAAQLRTQGITTCCAYLELCEPSLPDAASQLIAQGATHITIAPMFLGMGQHARHDLPEITAALERDAPHIIWKTLPTLGENEQVLHALAQYLQHSLTTP